MSWKLPEDRTHFAFFKAKCPTPSIRIAVPDVDTLGAQYLPGE